MSESRENPSRWGCWVKNASSSFFLPTVRQMPERSIYTILDRKIIMNTILPNGNITENCTFPGRVLKSFSMIVIGFKFL